MSSKKTLENTALKVLLINGSNRKGGNSSILTQKALDKVKEYSNVEVDEIAIYNKNYGRYDNPKDTVELLEKWNWADTVLFFLPNYTVGGPGSLYSAWERIAEASEKSIIEGEYKKSAGVLVQGSAKYGMAELAMESSFQMLAGIHVVPIYRLVAHIPDGTSPDDELLNGVSIMVDECITGGRLYKLSQETVGDKKARILVINSGLTQREIGIELEKRVIKNIEQAQNADVEVFRFPDEPLRDCHHCNVLCRKDLRCAFNDSFQDFFDKWVRADGIVWIISGDQNGVPAEIHYMHDRLSETGFSTVSDRVKRLGVPYRFCRYTKPEAAITYGKYGYGGQTQAQQFIVNVAEQRGNYFISGRVPSSLGPAALLRQPSQLGSDEFFTENVDNTVQDVIKIAAGIQNAKAALYDDLPELFFNSRSQMGVPNKEEYFA